MIDINQVIDQIELEEERDNRVYGNDEFEYIGTSKTRAVTEGGDAW